MRRAARIAGVAGPAGFIAAWVIGGVVREDYSSTSEAISRLAEQGASTQPVMTAGLLGFGLLMPVFARGLGQALGSPAVQAAVTASALATLAVAALPLSAEGGTTVDTLHNLAAGVAYAANVAGPLAVAPHLRTAAARRGSYALSAAMAAALVGSVVLDDVTGLLQRAGLTSYDLWAIALALTLLRPTEPVGAPAGVSRGAGGPPSARSRGRRRPRGRG